MHTDLLKTEEGQILWCTGIDVHFHTRNDDSPSGSYCGAIIVFTCPFLASAANYVTAERRGKRVGGQGETEQWNATVIEGLNLSQC